MDETLYINSQNPPDRKGGSSQSGILDTNQAISVYSTTPEPYHSKLDLGTGS